MLNLSYTLGLVVAISGLLLIDRHGKLAFWHDTPRTALTVAAAMILFIIWDLLGIHFGIFFSGTSPYMLGLYLWPQFPVEELLFLFLICYMPLSLYRGVESEYRHLSRTKH